jgi:hypothetical protein
MAAMNHSREEMVRKTKAKITGIYLFVEGLCCVLCVHTKAADSYRDPIDTVKMSETSQMWWLLVLLMEHLALAHEDDTQCTYAATTKNNNNSDDTCITGYVPKRSVDDTCVANVTCVYQCDSPTCQAVCRPVCQQPRCSRCFNNTGSGGSYSCVPINVSNTPRQNLCHVQCAPSFQQCPADFCPLCSILCPDGEVLHCTQENNCTVLCEEVQCSNQCRKPRIPQECPEPVCELQCGQPACEHTSPPTPSSAGGTQYIIHRCIATDLLYVGLFLVISSW